MRRLLVIFALSFVALGQANCSSGSNRARNSPNDQARSESPATPVSAADLIEAYRANEAKADSQYKGRTLAVTGIVSRKGKDYTGKPYVNLKADNPMIEVHCNYEDERDEAMSTLKQGQQVTIRGVCAGRLSAWVLMKESVLEQ